MQSRQNPVVLGVTLAKVNDRLAVWRLFQETIFGVLHVVPCKSERPLSGLETWGWGIAETQSGKSCKSERPLSGLETRATPPRKYNTSILAKVNDRLAVWRHYLSSFSL